SQSTAVPGYSAFVSVRSDRASQDFAFADTRTGLPSGATSTRSAPKGLGGGAAAIQRAYIRTGRAPPARSFDMILEAWHAAGAGAKRTWEPRKSTRARQPKRQRLAPP